MSEFFVQLVIARASVKLTLGYPDEPASDQLSLSGRLDDNEQRAFEAAHPDLVRPPAMRDVEMFNLNIYSSDSMVHQVHTNMRTVIADNVATINLQDRPEDIALASRYFADFGRSDVFKAELHLRAEGHDYVPLAIDLTMSRGLVA